MIRYSVDLGSPSHDRLRVGSHRSDSLRVLSIERLDGQLVRLGVDKPHLIVMVLLRWRASQNVDVNFRSETRALSERNAKSSVYFIPVSWNQGGRPQGMSLTRSNGYICRTDPPAVLTSSRAIHTENGIVGPFIAHTFGYSSWLYIYPAISL